jgi:DNA-binding GntR family transcriptional regulator
MVLIQLNARMSADWPSTARDHLELVDLMESRNVERAKSQIHEQLKGTLALALSAIKQQMNDTSSDMDASLQ